MCPSRESLYKEPRVQWSCLLVRILNEVFLLVLTRILSLKVFQRFQKPQIRYTYMHSGLPT